MSSQGKGCVSCAAYRLWKKPCVSSTCYHYIDGFAIGFIEWLVLVICPLKSIIRDQIEGADFLGLNAVELESPDMFENLPRLADKYCISFGRSGVR